MLVIPSLAFISFGVVIQFFGKSQWERLILFLYLLVITSSTTVLRWSVADLTDSLHLLLFSLCCLGLLRKWSIMALLLTVILGALTRPMGPIWATLFFSVSFSQKDERKLRYRLVAIFALALFFLNIYLMAIGDGFSPNNRSLQEQILGIPKKILQISIIEFAQIAVLDRTLFYCICFSLIVSILSIKNFWSMTHLLVTISSLLISAWIGVLGVNFRYQLPCLATAAIVFMHESKFILQTPKFYQISNKLNRGFKDNY